MRRRGFLKALAGGLFACCTRLVPDLAPRTITGQGFRASRYVVLTDLPPQGYNCRCIIRLIEPGEYVQPCGRRYGMTDHPKRLQVVRKPPE